MTVVCELQPMSRCQGPCELANMQADQDYSHCGALETAFLTTALQNWWKEGLRRLFQGNCLYLRCKNQELCEKASAMFHRNWEEY